MALRSVPKRRIEVVFQWLRTRRPFDEEQLREEFRQLCNRTPGVDLPAVKIGLRPSFPLSVLADDEARERLQDALEWFVLTARTK